MRIHLLVLTILFCFSSCVEIPNSHESLPPGIWRAYFKLYDSELVGIDLADSKTDIPYKELPFNFEIRYKPDGDMSLALINSTDSLEISEVTIGLDRATAKDTITIDLPVFNSYIKAIYEEGIMEGNWHVRYKKNYQIPFIAVHGQSHRFSSGNEKPLSNLTGRWKTTFDFDKEGEEYMAIGEFVQKGNRIDGTFRTETGDYRFLQGNVIGKKLYLSTFDGAHAFLFEALINDDNNLIGLFKSGKHYHSNWVAQRDDSFELADPNSLTKATDQDVAVDFSFVNTEGQMVSISDPKFASKNKVVNIMGTWCPNCLDEMNFLKTYFEKNKNNSIVPLTISFERFKDKQRSIESIKRYKEKLNIPWDILYGGYANKTENLKVLPFIDTLISYPTLLILDKQNKIQYIHTGFSGPATSMYDSFISDFNNEIDKLIQNENGI